MWEWKKTQLISDKTQGHRKISQKQQKFSRVLGWENYHDKTPLKIERKLFHVIFSNRKRSVKSHTKSLQAKSLNILVNTEGMPERHVYKI